MKTTIPEYVAARVRAGRSSDSLVATVLHVDLVAFTALTEAFLQGGTRGAEALSDMLNRVYAAPVAAVFRFGGFVSSFLGDAFVALFPDDPGHARSRKDAEGQVAELKQLLLKVGEAEPGDWSCDEAFAALDDYAEHVSSGSSPNAAMAAVEKHLRNCSDCREEYELLRDMQRSDD